MDSENPFKAKIDKLIDARINDGPYAHLLRQYAKFGIIVSDEFIMKKIEELTQRFPSQAIHRVYLFEEKKVNDRNMVEVYLMWRFV